MATKETAADLRERFMAAMQTARTRKRDAHGDAAMLQRAASSLASSVDGIKGELDKSLAQIERKIYETQYPMLSSGDTQHRLIGTLEQTNALLSGELFPIETVRESVRIGRTDFASALIERGLSAKPATAEGMVAQEELRQAAGELFGAGLEDLQRERRELVSLQREVGEIAARIAADPDDIDEISKAMREQYAPGQQQIFELKRER